MADDEATSSTVTIQLNTDYQSAVRFPAWIALTTFSAICVAALDTGDKSTGWCMAVCVISMCLAFFATVAYLTARHLFVGTTVEAAWVFLILAFWGAGLPVIMNPSKHIATRGTEVLNANLYFFSWGAFATCLFLLSSILQELFGIDVRETSSKAARYYGLCAASLVVMGSSIRLYTDNEVCDFSDVNQISYCRRSKLGIAIGTISFILTAAVSYAMHIKLQQLTNLYETIGTTLLLILWCFGVGFITFSDGPGGQIGNLYFATWISFLMSVFLFAGNFRDYVSGMAATTEENKGEHHPANPSVEQNIPDEEDI